MDTGEKSGNLEQVLRRYVSYVKIVSSVKRKTISALVYPAILLVLSLIVVAIIVVKVVPKDEFLKWLDTQEAALAPPPAAAATAVTPAAEVPQAPKG